MIRRVASLLLRLASAAFFLLTAAYGIVCYSPFAFDMFIRPQLLPWVRDFVAWHHVWYVAAYAATVATLAGEMTSRAGGERTAAAARYLAIAYAVVFGAVGVWLVSSPFLPTVQNDSRSLVVATTALVPLLWLTVIDHLGAGQASRANAYATASPIGPRLFRCCLATAGYLWAVHLLRAILTANDAGSMLAWMLTGSWALALSAATFLIAYAALSLASAVGESMPGAARWWCEYAMTLVLLAAGLSEFFRRAVFTTIAFEGPAAAGVAVALAVALVTGWAGVALRVRWRPSAPPAAPVDLIFVAPSTRAASLAGLAVLPFASAWALAASAQADWMFVIQRVIVLGEAAAAFSLVLGVSSAVTIARVSSAAPLVATGITLAALVSVPRLGAAAAAGAGDAAAHQALALEQYAAADPAFRLMAAAVVNWPGHDASYYEYLQSNGSPNTSVTIPEVRLAANFSATAARPPDIFVFVVDSLRRDYLSPYNPAVGFTPEIGRFAAESFAFRNAFTRHGGTALSMPALWAGGFMVRRDPHFNRMNAIEKLLDAEGYRIAINDFTVAELLNQRSVTFLDPGVPSVETDLCRNVESLKTYLDASTANPAPVFGYLAPMNVHLLNTRQGGRPSPSNREYHGFYSPYASRLERIDRCFGEFISYLKARGRYDSSIVVLTSDHGDSLGEGNRWGHAYWLFPEDVRVPLIVRLPPAMRGELTTDLERLAFTTDIAPTLYALLGHEVRDLGVLFGSPLFVPSDGELVDRRREAFLITSSYAATYGLLRRNGRFLFITDLFERKEFAFDLRDGLLGRPMTIGHELRALNQRLIRERVGEVARFYRVTPK